MHQVQYLQDEEVANIVGGLFVPPQYAMESFDRNLVRKPQVPDLT